MKLHRAAIAVLLAITTACAARPPGTRPDEMSAAEHRSAARSHRRAGSEHARGFDPNARARQPASYGLPSVRAINSDEPLGGGTVAYGDRVHNPTERHRERAEEHREHAREHAGAAAALEASAAAACRALPAKSRSECPLLAGVVAVEAISGGARVRLAAPASVASFVARARCHQAFARERHFQGMSACPLYLPEVEVKPASDGASVLIQSSNRTIAAAIRERVAVPAE